MGQLTVHDRFVVGCMDSGVGLLHPCGRLSVIDVADPEAPVMTDYLSAPPWAVAGETSMFFCLEPLGDELVLAGLVNGTGLRTHHTEMNRQYLARADVDDDGRIVWLGRVEHEGPWNAGFALSGDRALWVVGLLNFSVDLGSGLEMPVLHGADHHFSGGRLRFLPEHQTLVAANRLYHMADIRESDVPGSAPPTLYSPGTFIAMEEPFFATWITWSDPGGEYWIVRSYDGRTSPPTLINSVGGGGWSPTRCVAFGPRMYLSTSSLAAARIDMDADGRLSEPVDAGPPFIRCSLRWDGFVVAATTDSLKVCTFDEDGSLSTVAGLNWPLANSIVALVRAGDFLFARDAYSSTYCFDLSNILQPTLEYGIAGFWQTSLRYSSDWNLLFDFGNSVLRWRTVNADGHPAARFQLVDAVPFGHPGYRDSRRYPLHAARRGRLRGVRLRPRDGADADGADLSVAATHLFPLPDNRYLLGPTLIEQPLHCADPLPVAISGFGADPQPSGVHLSWSCSTDAFAGAAFEIFVEDAHAVRRVARHEANRGRHEAIDTVAAGTEPTVYSLYLVQSTGERSLLDAFTLAAWRSDEHQFALVAAPNPLDPRTSIRYSLPTAGPVRLRVFDLSGRVVRTLVEGLEPKGESVVEWDGCDDAGSRVGSGTYIAHLESDRRSASVRLQLIR